MITPWPFPSKEIERLSEKSKRMIVPEVNYGQIEHLVREFAECPVIGVHHPAGSLIPPEKIYTRLWRFCRMTQVEVPSEFEMMKPTNPKDEMLRADRLPHIWCPGCGLGIVLGCLVEAIRGSSIPRDKHVIVSGIGCTSRIPGYLNLDTYHTTHGRAIPFATGIKIANPELEVTVIAGDGDLFNIGGNHLIHAIRRNVDLNVFCVNNFNYGMTGGQFGATTPTGAKTPPPLTAISKLPSTYRTWWPQPELHSWPDGRRYT